MARSTRQKRGSARVRGRGHRRYNNGGDGGENVAPSNHHGSPTRKNPTRNTTINNFGFVTLRYPAGARRFSTELPTPPASFTASTAVSTPRVSGVGFSPVDVNCSTPATTTFQEADVDMAPAVKDMNNVQDALKDVVQNLFDMQSQVHGYQLETQDPLVEKVIDLTNSLAHLRSLSTAQSSTLPSIPPELVDYIDEGRNPDIYTREIIEAVQRGNAVVNGKREAFRGFSMVFAKALLDGGLEVDESQENAQGGSRGLDMGREVRRIMENADLPLPDSFSSRRDGGSSSGMARMEPKP